MDQESEEHKYAFIHIPKNAGMSISKAIKHIPIIKSYGHGVFFENVAHLNKLFVVREPIDRFTSSFFYVKKHYITDLFRDPEELICSILSNDGKSNNFLKFQKNPHRVNGSEIPTDWVFHPQSAWVHDPFRILLFDNLDNEISKLGNELNADIILPKVNVSDRIDFKYSDESINFLKMRYKDDFELYKSVMIGRGVYYTY